MSSNNETEALALATKRQVESYYDHINNCATDALPEWVRDVKRAVLTGNENLLTGYLPWVWNVYEWVLFNETNKTSSSDE